MEDIEIVTKKEENNKKLKLYLEDDKENGGVSIKCIDFRNDNWYILRITKDGYLGFIGGIPNDIGLKVDGAGQLKISVMH